MPDVHPSKPAPKPRRGNEYPIELTEHERAFFWAQVEESASGCWSWVGHIIDRGYGICRLRGLNYRAHRISWTLTHGYICRGLTLDHLCRNRACVNPSHLEAVPNSENILRGKSPTALNAQKTHCKRGHEFTDANTLRRRGRRECWQCRKDRRRQLKQWRSGAHRAVSA